MSATVFITWLGLTLLGFVLSALFSGLETGLYTLNRVRLAVRAARRDPPALRLRRELGNVRRALSVLLIGTNAANYLGSYGLAELLHGLGISDWALIVLEAAIFTPLVFVFAETLPKELFRTHTDRWTYSLSPVLLWSRRMMTYTALLPSIQLLTGLIGRAFGSRDQQVTTARQRISQLIKEGARAGVISEAQTTLADRALALRDRRVPSVMVPWRHAVSIPLDADHSRREARMRQRNFTRLPVTGGDGRVVGVLSWVDAMLHHDRRTESLMQPALIFSPTTRLLEALSTMRHEQQAMGIIADEQTGKPLGLVTLKDLVEPLTGELGAW